MSEQQDTPKTMLPRLAFIGGGVMGGTIISAARVAGWPQDRIIVADHNDARAGALREGHGIRVISSVPDAVADADVVIFAVKPQDAGPVLAELAGSMKSGAMLLTVAAGLKAAYYESALPAGTPVVRAMPNTPAVVAKGATAIAPGAHAGEQHMTLAMSILRASGLVVAVDESQIDAVAAVSGSGPAYFYAFVEALTEAGVAQGLDRVLATQLAAQTFVGAAALLQHSGDTPQDLRRKVSSKGGSTLAALEAMESSGLQGVVSTGAAAAMRRAKEMSEEFSK
jgi:pyrroline-5-carboxylate reductase